MKFILGYKHNSELKITLILMFQTKDTDACVATRILFIVVKFLVAKLETPHSLQSIKRGLVLSTVLRNIFLQKNS